MTEDLDHLIADALGRLSRTDAAPNSNDLACALRALLLVAQGQRAPKAPALHVDTGGALTPAQQRAAYMEGLNAPSPDRLT